MVDTIGTELLNVLRGHPQQALFGTELVARLGSAAPAGAALEQLLATLDPGAALVVDHAAPDPHLDGDLRVVALGGSGAEANAERVWTAWLREVRTAHRCC